MLRLLAILCNVRIDQNREYTCDGTMDMHNNKGKYIRAAVKFVDISNVSDILGRNEHFLAFEVKYLDRRCLF